MEFKLVTHCICMGHNYFLITFSSSLRFPIWISIGYSSVSCLIMIRFRPKRHWGTWGSKGLNKFLNINYVTKVGKIFIFITHLCFHQDVNPQYWNNAIGCNSVFIQGTTGRPVCIGTVGVASKPVEPHPLSFAGFFIYIKRKFVANLKLIGALMLT